MNRAQRRKQSKNQRGMPAFVKLTREERMDALVKNGITAKDLEDNYKKGHEAGYNEGFKQAGDPMVKMIYAAICLALNDTNKFGSKRCMEVLRKVEYYVTHELTYMEAAQKVFDRMKLHLDFNEPFERIYFMDDD